MKQDDKRSIIIGNHLIQLYMKTKILSIILCLCGFTLHVSANEKIYVNCEVTIMVKVTILLLLV